MVPGPKNWNIQNPALNQVGLGEMLKLGLLWGPECPVLIEVIFLHQSSAETSALLGRAKYSEGHLRRGQGGGDPHQGLCARNSKP